MQNNNTAVIFNDLQIAQVEALANYLPIEQVAGYFNLSVSNFLDLQKKDERVLRAYRKGKVRGMCKVAELLWQQMEAGNVSAIIFFLKTRGGWSERPFTETGDNAPKFKNIKLICTEFEQEKAKDRMQITQFKEVDATASLMAGYPEVEKVNNEQKGKTLEVIAQKTGVSHMTDFQYDTIQQQATNKKVYTNICKAELLGIDKGAEQQKVFIPIPVGVMLTKEATEVLARL